MKVELKEDEEEIYISCMGSGIEARRLVKRLWKNGKYDFSFAEKPRFVDDRIYQIHISYNYITGRCDVDVCGQETVINILAYSEYTVLAVTSYSYGID